MKLFSLTMVLTMLVGTFVFASPVGSTYIPPKPTSPKEAITYYSNLYGANEAILMKMADCESDFHPSIKGDGGRAHGLFQYHKGTFDRYAKLSGMTLDYYSYEDQAQLTAWLYVNKPESLREWTSYRAIQNGGTYKFYSKLLQRHYVVTCKL